MSTVGVLLRALKVVKFLTFQPLKNLTGIFNYGLIWCNKKATENSGSI